MSDTTNEEIINILHQHEIIKIPYHSYPLYFFLTFIGFITGIATTFILINIKV